MTSYLARVYYTPDGVTAAFAVPFPYIAQSHVHIFSAGVEVLSGFSWSNSTTLLFAPPLASGAANSLEIVRTTPNSAMLSTMQTGTIDPTDINLDDLQLLYISQEQADQEVYDFTSASGIIAQILAMAGVVSAASGLYPIPVAGIANAPGAATDYIVGTSPTGAFATKANQIAHFYNGAWIFLTPLNGLVLQGTNLGSFFSYMNGAWRLGLCVGGDTSAISAEVFPVFDVVQDNAVSTAFASVVSQFGSTGGPTSHWHKYRGSPSAPLYAHNGDLGLDYGIRFCRETGHVGGSPAAAFVSLLEDSNGTDYPGVTWQWRGTSIGTGAPTIWMALYQGFLGLNDNTPASALSIQFNNNSATKATLKNTNVGSSASTQLVFDNGTHQSQLIQYGTGVSNSFPTQQDGLLVNAAGAGGLVLNTALAQPIYFGINNVLNWSIGTTGVLGPATNNTKDIGTSGIACRNIYSVNALNVTSDAQTKEEIRDLTDAEIAAGNAISWKIFKHIGGDRLHAGVIAQDVEKAFLAHGLDPYAYGVIGKGLVFENIEETETGTEQVHVMAPVTHRKEVYKIVDGVAVQTFEEETRDEMVVDTFPAYDAGGSPILEKGGIQLMVSVPKMEAKAYSRQVVRKDVPVLDAEGKQVERRWVRYTELMAFCLAAHEARLDHHDGK